MHGELQLADRSLSASPGSRRCCDCSPDHSPGCHLLHACPGKPQARHLGRALPPHPEETREPFRSNRSGFKAPLLFFLIFIPPSLSVWQNPQATRGASRRSPRLLAHSSPHVALSAGGHVPIAPALRSSRPSNADQRWWRRRRQLGGVLQTRAWHQKKKKKKQRLGRRDGSPGDDFDPLCAREAAGTRSPRAPQVLPRRRSGRGFSVLQPPPSPAHPRGTWHSEGGEGGKLASVPCLAGGARTQPLARRELPAFGGVEFPLIRRAGKSGTGSERDVWRAPRPASPAGSVCRRRRGQVKSQQQSLPKWARQDFPPPSARLRKGYQVSSPPLGFRAPGSALPCKSSVLLNASFKKTFPAVSLDPASDSLPPG